MIKKVKKIGNLTIRLEKSLLDKYKSHCDKNGYDMSKRLRLFIESEIPIEYNMINIIDLIYEPTSDIEVVNILGFNFPTIKSSPRVFIIKTDDFISENISFYFKGRIYKIEGCIINKVDNNILIECKRCSIEFF